ncbi:MAG: domain S-box [Candidatus Peribacteria bacterium]|nr:domain S-box [Candidatus Peribacteria bacterium]
MSVKSDILRQKNPRKRKTASTISAKETARTRLSFLGQKVSDAKEAWKGNDKKSGEIEESYKSLAEAIPQIVWTSDPDGYNDYFNRQWFQYTGLTEEETYHTNKEAIHPDDLGLAQQRWGDALKTGEAYEVEYRFLRASDGQYRWHLGRAVPVKNAKGAIIKWIGTCTDIHDQKEHAERMRRINEELEEKVRIRTKELEDEIQERKRMEQRDKANFQRLQSVMESMLLGAIITDEQKRIIHINEQFCNMFSINKRPSEFYGKTMDELANVIMNKLQFPQEYLARLAKTVDNLQPVANHELALRNGKILMREYVPIFVDAVHRGHLLLYRDVTQERKIDASKSEFMSLASHQLRTPLTAIRWILSKMSKSSAHKLNEDEQRLLQEGRNATIRMANTIDTMLAISRIEAGHVQLKLTDIHLESLCHELKSQFTTDAAHKGQEIVVECPSNLFIVTDNSLLRECIRNLLGNAIKYTPNGQKIYLRATEQNNYVTISVQDTGYGIPQDQQTKIFTKFFRGSNVVDRETEGTGLGLYLVHLLVTMLGGTISFVSEEERGTTFTILLPTVAEPHDPSYSAR